MKVTIYSIQNCRYCDAVKNFFTNSNIDYTEIPVLRLGETGDGMEFKEFCKVHTGLKIFPQVYVDDKCVGGVLETIRYFNGTK